MHVMRAAPVRLYRRCVRSIGRLTASGGMCASDESGSCEAIQALCEKCREANSKRGYVCASNKLLVIMEL